MDKPVRKIDSFKKLPKVAEPVKATIDESGLMPGMMKPGTVLTEIEKEGLKQLGIVNDTATIPADIAKRISDIVATADKQDTLAVPTVAFKMPKPVDFKDLSPEKKKDIINAVKEAVEMGEAERDKKKAEESAEPPRNPAIFKEPEIIDDLLDKNKVKVEESSANNTEKGYSYSGISKTAESVMCAHCGWDTRKQDLVEVTSDDKIDFVQSILGGVRFKKIYSVFGDRMHITFRTLTSSESDMAYKQLIVDSNNDIQTKILGDTSFYWRTLMAYRCIMSIERVESSEGILEIPAIANIAVDDESYSRPNTKLSAVFDNLIEQVMPTEIIRTTITHLYTEFQSLCEKLQAMAESKDFWMATK